MSHDDRDGLVVAIVGATGAVGEMRKVLEERKFPVKRLVPLASGRSAGQTITWNHRNYRRELDDDSFKDVDIALFSAGAHISEQYGPIAAAAGAFVVDNSRAFRMNPNVPLVVPEVNPEALDSPSKSLLTELFNDPDGVALRPLHEHAGLKRVVVSTYQSASGGGRDAMDELREQTVSLLNFRSPPIENFSRRLAFDTIPQIDRFEDDGFTREEHKMIFETRKIMSLPNIGICATCVRVPVFVVMP